MSNWSPEQWALVIGFVITAITGGIVKIILALQGVGHKVDALEIKVDGRLTQLLERTASASRAQGVEAGRGEMVVPAAAAAPVVVDENHLVVGIPTPMPPVLLVPVEAPDKEGRSGKE